VLTAPGHAATVLASESTAHPDGIIVYNFTVEASHTYFVDDGLDDIAAIWVHNRKRPKVPQVTANKRAGTAREGAIGDELRVQYPDASVQSERYLRLRTGERAIDPLTGTARRIDWVVTKNGVVLDSVEVTSMGASKAAQIAKEMRIRNLGGVYVRDRITRELVSVRDVTTRITRRL
jgi:hypothetical protein